MTTERTNQTNTPVGAMVSIEMQQLGLSGSWQVAPPSATDASAASATTQTPYEANPNFGSVGARIKHWFEPATKAIDKASNGRDGWEKVGFGLLGVGKGCLLAGGGLLLGIGAALSFIPSALDPKNAKQFTSPATQTEAPKLTSESPKTNPKRAALGLMIEYLATITIALPLIRFLSSGIATMCAKLAGHEGAMDIVETNITYARLRFNNLEKGATMTAQQILRSFPSVHQIRVQFGHDALQQIAQKKIECSPKEITDHIDKLVKDYIDAQEKYKTSMQGSEDRNLNLETLKDRQEKKQAMLNAAKLIKRIPDQFKEYTYTKYMEYRAQNHTTAWLKIYPDTTLENLVKHYNKEDYKWDTLYDEKNGTDLDLFIAQWAKTKQSNGKPILTMKPNSTSELETPQITTPSLSSADYARLVLNNPDLADRLKFLSSQSSSTPTV